MTAHHDDLDKQWYGWGSALGMGLVVLCFGLAVAAILAAISLLV
jgi:hypothetical protein